MNIQKEIIDNQTLHSHALFFDPVEKDLVLASDEKGRPMGRYVPKPTAEGISQKPLVFHMELQFEGFVFPFSSKMKALHTFLHAFPQIKFFVIESYLPLLHAGHI